jgi:DNA modification methylase
LTTLQEIPPRSLWYCPTRIGFCLVRVEGLQTAAFGEPERIRITRAFGGDAVTFDGGVGRDLRLPGFLRRYRPCMDPSGLVVPVLAEMLPPPAVPVFEPPDPRQTAMPFDQAGGTPCAPEEPDGGPAPDGAITAPAAAPADPAGGCVVSAVVVGDARQAAAEAPVVHLVMCSPPYLRKRLYLPEGHPRASLEIGRGGSPQGYIRDLTAVFRAWRDRMHSSGSLVVNLGDRFASVKEDLEPAWGIKSGDLMRLPSHLADALQEDGWYVRAVVPWVCSGGKPESVAYRPVNRMEWMIFATKSDAGFYDLDATLLKARWVEGPRRRRVSDWSFESLDQAIEAERAYLAHLEAARSGAGILLDRGGLPLAHVAAVQPGRSGHKASMPPKLVAPWLACLTSGAGCCPTCLAPWTREVEVLGPTAREIKKARGATAYAEVYQGAAPADGLDYKGRHTAAARPRRTLGWQPSCGHRDVGPVPCRVADPFCGSGTVIVEAARMGRVGYGVDLDEESVAQAQAALAAVGPVGEGR